MVWLKSKYEEQAKLCYVDTKSFIVYLKTDNIYNNIAEEIKKKFDTSNYELDRPLSKRKKEKSNWIGERWLSGKIMK